MNFSERVVINTSMQVWQPSPMPAVMRKPLSRGRNESRYATCLVSYAPCSYFKSQRHSGGAEIFVLEGSFSD